MTEEPEYTSESGDRWVSLLIDEARDNNPLVADAVLARMGLLLIGQISERDLTPTEVAPEI